MPGSHRTPRRSTRPISANARHEVVIALACSAWATHAETILKAADVHSHGYPTVVAVKSLGKKLEANLKGKCSVRMHPSGVLGDEKTMIEQAQVGAIQLLRTSLGPVGPVVPEANVFSMPFGFRNEKRMRGVIDGGIGPELLDKITASPARPSHSPEWTAARAASAPRSR